MKVLGNLMYFISYLTEVLTMTNSFYYPQTFNSAKLSNLNRFSKAPRDIFEFRSYLILCLTDNLAMTYFWHYPPIFKWAIFLTSNMFSEASRGQIKKVMIFALWFDMNWNSLALLLHADVVWWIDLCSSHINWGHYNLKVSDQNIAALIIFIFSFKCSWCMLRYSEVVTRKCYSFYILWMFFFTTMFFRVPILYNISERAGPPQAFSYWGGNVFQNKAPLKAFEFRRRSGLQC